MVKEMSAGTKSPQKADKVEKTFETLSGIPLKPFYTKEDVQALDYDRDLADPGIYPYTRGIHESMYRGKVWTMRQFAGFGGPEETNKRFK